MITRPTRITSHTATLLDNIFANKFFDHSRSDLLITDISDHLPVFSIHSNNDSSNSHAHDQWSLRQSSLNKAWLSNALIKCIKEKIGFIGEYLQNPTMDRQSIYKSNKNKLNHSLRIAKRLYYEKKLNNVQSNTRATWKSFK